MAANGEDKVEEISFRMKQIIKSFSGIINDLVQENTNLMEKNRGSNFNEGKNFVLKKRPKITIEGYISRIAKYSEAEEATLISSYILIDKICKKNIIITKNNVFLITLISIITSQKILEDTIFDNKYYSEIGGITLKELNKIEYEFDCLLNFDLFLPEEDYNQFKKLLFKIGKIE